MHGTNGCVPGMFLFFLLFRWLVVETILVFHPAKWWSPVTSIHSSGGWNHQPVYFLRIAIKIEAFLARSWMRRGPARPAGGCWRAGRKDHGTHRREGHWNDGLVMGNYPQMLLIQIWVGELLYYHLNPIEQCSAVPKTEWNPSKTSKNLDDEWGWRITHK